MDRKGVVSVEYSGYNVHGQAGEVPRCQKFENRLGRLGGARAMAMEFWDAGWKSRVY